MNTIRDDLMSVSSNSLSISDETKIQAPPPKKKAKTTAKVKAKYTIKDAHVPKRTFQRIHRLMKRNKSIIELKAQTMEKANCNRFILNQIEGDKMETISPESTTRLMWEMRERLQRREYGDLARLISTFTEMPMGKSRWYSTFIKYCLIALMYDPLVQGTGLMEMFLDGVTGCLSAADKKQFLQDINRMPTNIHVTKFDDLWSEYPIPNQFNQHSVDQLCEILNKRVHIKNESDDLDSDESDINSDWETYDENSSSDENETTTEPEKVISLSSIMNQIQNKYIS